MNRLPRRIAIESNHEKGLSHVHGLLDREMQGMRAAEGVTLLCCQVKKRIDTFAALAQKRRMEP